jgi:hypothetical protein
LYFWKVRENPQGKTGEILCNTLFTLVRFNLKREKEETVEGTGPNPGDYYYNWSSKDRNALERCNHADHPDGSPNPHSPKHHDDHSDEGSPQSPVEKDKGNYALSAIFVNKSDQKSFKTEREFLDS